jgi:hypothetical protein
MFEMKRLSVFNGPTFELITEQVEVSRGEVKE